MREENQGGCSAVERAWLETHFWQRSQNATNFSAGGQHIMKYRLAFRCVICRHRDVRWQRFRTVFGHTVHEMGWQDCLNFASNDWATFAIMSDTNGDVSCVSWFLLKQPHLEKGPVTTKPSSSLSWDHKKDWSHHEDLLGSIQQQKFPKDQSSPRVWTHQASRLSKAV